MVVGCDITDMHQPGLIQLFRTIKRLVEFDPVFEDEVAVVFAVPETSLSTEFSTAYVASQGTGL